MQLWWQMLELLFFFVQVYGGVYTEDKQWYRCRVKKLIEEDKVTHYNVTILNT